MRKLTVEEHATILAALRVWQISRAKREPAALAATADHFADCDPVPDDKINALCEEINCAGLALGADEAQSAMRAWVAALLDRLLSWERDVLGGSEAKAWAKARRMRDILRGEVAPRCTCPRCGGARISETAWVDSNTGEVLDEESPTDDYYCADCDDTMGDILIDGKNGQQRLREMNLAQAKADTEHQ